MDDPLAKLFVKEVNAIVLLLDILDDKIKWLLSSLGMIHRREGRNEEARQDFQKASEMGSNFANSALTAMNPYAAMCNQMLKNVFQALEEGANQVEDPFKPQGTHRG